MLGCNISNHCVNSSRSWIWRNRSGVGRNCEIVILSVPGDVRDLLCLRVEGKKGSIMTGCVWQRWIQSNKHKQVGGYGFAELWLVKKKGSSDAVGTEG